MKNFDKTIDNQDIVRCKDCCLHKETTDGLLICRMPFINQASNCFLMVSPDYYCVVGGKDPGLFAPVNHNFVGDTPITRCEDCANCSNQPVTTIDGTTYDEYHCARLLHGASIVHGEGFCAYGDDDLGENGEED